nr:MAG TPA_asm: hypothetical protein [Caudoviricetes sp.]
MRKGETPAQDRINKKEFEKLCSLQCTLLEICDWFDVEDDTLNIWCRNTYGKTFSEVFKVKRGTGQISLRRTQWQLAQKNPSMAIFLGKQYLGQTDKVQTTNSIVETPEIKVSVIDNENLKEELYENK